MLEAAIFPQKYDGRVMPPEMSQGCSEGRESGGRREAELRVRTGEALVGVRARWQPGESTKGREESGEEEYAEKLWPAIVLE